MTQVKTNWFARVPWEKVESIHQGFCEARQLRTAANPSGFAEARSLWEGAMDNEHTLWQALDLCRRCVAAKPFIFMSINTMTAAACKLLQDRLDVMPAVEAQIIRTTVSHYVADRVPFGELEQVLKHFENVWPGGETRTVTAPLYEAPLPDTQPRPAV